MSAITATPAQAARAAASLRRRRWPVAVLVLVHLVLVVGAMAGTLFLANPTAQNRAAFVRAAPIVTAIFLGTFAYHLLYEREPFDTYTEGLRVVGRATLIGAIGSLAAIYAVGAVGFPRRVALIGMPIILVGTYAIEAGRLGYRLRRRPQRRAVILGPEDIGAPLVQHFEQRPTASLGVVERLDTHELTRRLESPGPPPYDLVLIPGPGQLRYTPTRLLLAARSRGIRIFMLAGEAGAFLGLSELHEMGGLPWHELRVQSLPVARRAAKRFLDLVLVLGAAPVAMVAGAAIAVAVRTQGKGVLHRQVRAGRGGTTFTLVKFRTMRDGAEEMGIRLADADDPRVTRIGRFLRRHRLDELPQLWNVLKGEMSLVGPRPERSELIESYESEVPGYRERHAIRPGITGLAQVLGGYDTPAEHKIRYDLLYVANWSIWLDVQILLKTAVVVVRGTGAR